MAFITPSIDVFLFSSAVFLASWFYLTLPTLSPSSNENNAQNPQKQTGQQRRRSSHTQAETVTPNQNQNQPQTRTRYLLSVLVALHSIYILYKLIVQRPPNLFTSLQVPLTEPSENIRQILLHEASRRTGAGPGTLVLPMGLEEMLTRLQSFDARVAYVRFGHSVVQSCTHCTSLSSFASYALPAPLLEYVRTAAFIGFMTLRGSRREAWRIWALGVLALAAAAECYFVLNKAVAFTNGGGEMKTVMVHDTALQIRRLFFLLLPPLLYLLPPSFQKTSPLQALPDLTARLELTRARLQLLRLTSAARARHPALRAASDAWWERQRGEGRSAVDDPKLREMARNLGMGLDEDEGGEGGGGGGGGEEDGKGLRGRARVVVGVLQDGFRTKV